MNSRQSQIILRPLINEKSALLAQQGKYTFEVLKDANKIEIAEALEMLLGEVYNQKATVTSVNTLPIRGRIRRSKRHGRAPRDSKKAIVTIEGEPLSIFSA
ncbi:MAG TPA: 50S ribosomal protein L23 [Drouetiella sp.]